MYNFKLREGSSCQALVCGESGCLASCASRGGRGSRARWLVADADTLETEKQIFHLLMWDYEETSTLSHRRFSNFSDIPKTFTCLPFIRCMILKHQLICFSDTSSLHLCSSMQFFATGGSPMGSAVRGPVLHRAQASY